MLATLFFGMMDDNPRIVLPSESEIFETTFSEEFYAEGVELFDWESERAGCELELCRDRRIIRLQWWQTQKVDFKFHFDVGSKLRMRMNNFSHDEILLRFKLIGRLKKEE